MLPDVEGTQICRQIRAVQHESYVYIIMLTAKGQKKDVIEGLDAGADDYVIKPFDMQELDARLRAHRSWARLPRWGEERRNAKDAH